MIYKHIFKDSSYVPKSFKASLIDKF